MVDFQDFKKTYTLAEIKPTGKITSYLGLFNQNIWDMGDILLQGKNSYTHSPTERLYFMPGCTVARIKVRDLCAKQGGAIVKDPARATTIFYSEDSVKELFEIPTAHKISRGHFLKWLKAAYVDEVKADSPHKIDLLNIYNEESAKILNSQSPFVLISKMGVTDQYVQGQVSCDWIGDDISVDVGIPDSHWADANGVAVIEGQENKAVIIASPNLCSQDAIIKHLNVMEIDDNMYNEVRKMLVSDDEQNTTLGMEIMANCNYDKSISYLIALMKNNYSDIASSNTYSHVNFKTFRTYIEIPGQTHWNNKSLNDMGQILKVRGQNTKENRELLLKLLAPCLYEDEATDIEEGGPFEDFKDDDGVDILMEGDE